MSNEVFLTEDAKIRSAILKNSGVDFWKIDKANQTIYLCDNLVKALSLQKNLYHISEQEDYLENSVKDIFMSALFIKDDKPISIPLLKEKFPNLKASIFITGNDKDQICGYAKVIEEGEETVSSRENIGMDAKLKFLANMSHDMRTPINVIVGFAKILAETDDPQEKEEYLNLIMENNDIILRLINDILDISKIEAGVLEIKLTEFDIVAKLRDIKQGMQLNINKPNLQFILKEPEGINSLIIKSDTNRLSQVINNLIGNAIKFTRSGSITLSYEVEEKQITFCVTDTGIGIPQSEQGSIFSRFTRLNKNQNGTGLGLEISSSIVRHLGGKIGVRSEEGKGSTFWFTLPLEQNYNVQKKQELYVNKAEEAANKTEKQSILIAEDNIGNYKLCEALLRNSYELHHAWNGEEAVEMFDRLAPKLILMDINMPQMNGYEAMQKIRKKGKSVSIIATTAYALADDKEKLLESGFDDYISKPLDAAQLKEMISKELKKEV